MKKQNTGFKPLNNCLLVKRVSEKPGGERMVDGIIVPQESSAGETYQVVEIVAISDEIKNPNGGPVSVKAGDRVAIGVNVAGTPMKFNGVEHLLIGYTTLMGVVS